MKVVILHDVFFFDEAVAAMQEVATVTIMRDDSKAALLAEIADADAIAVGPGTFVDRPSLNRRPA